MTPSKGKKGRETLNREKIVERALEILDEDGLEGLSMRRLGDALGVEAMALYHHFPSKDAMLDAIVERILEEVGPALPVAEADQDWKAVMMSGPAATGRALEAHPKAGWLFLGRQYGTAESLRMLEAPLRILHTAGFHGQQLVDAAHAIFAYTAGWYVLAAGEGGSWSGPDQEAIDAVGDAAPLTSAMAPQLRDWSRGMEEGFRALLDGLEAKLEE
jgi:AcrR family transcriptional regulator